MRYLRTNSGHTRIRSPTRRAHITIHSPHRTMASFAAFPADPGDSIDLPAFRTGIGPELRIDLLQPYGRLCAGAFLHWPRGVLRHIK
jgi:hypothetical protein